MALTLDGSGDITGLVAGALPSTVIGTGAVLQVVQYQYTSFFSTSSSSFVDVTSFAATITPTSATSRILIQLSTSALHSSTGQGEYRITRNGSDPASIAGGRMWNSDGYYGNGTVNDVASIFLDSPNTTSSLTYQLQTRNRHSTSMIIGKDWNGDVGGVHTIILMEIA